MWELTAPVLGVKIGVVDESAYEQSYMVEHPSSTHENPDDDEESDEILHEEFGTCVDEPGHPFDEGPNPPEDGPEEPRTFFAFFSHFLPVPAS